MDDVDTDTDTDTDVDNATLDGGPGNDHLRNKVNASGMPLGGEGDDVLAPHE
jgi:hypothetical protein